MRQFLLNHKIGFMDETRAEGGLQPGRPPGRDFSPAHGRSGAKAPRGLKPTLYLILCVLAFAQSGRYPGSGTSGPGEPVKGDGWGGWRTSADGVAYRGPYPKQEWSLKFDGLATASAVTRGLLPAIRPLAELHMRDTYIARGGDGNYYMTGTTGDNPYWFNDGVELWRSPDLQHWEYIGLV